MNEHLPLLINYLILCCAIVLLDIKFRIIPDALTIPGALFAVLINTIDPNLIGFQQSILGYGIGGLSILLAGMLCFAVSRRDALGGGDLKLIAMIGAFWGWKVALLTFAISPIAGSVYAMIYNKPRISYGVFLVGCSLLSLMVWQF